MIDRGFYVGCNMISSQAEPSENINLTPVYFLGFYFIYLFI